MNDEQEIRDVVKDWLAASEDGDLQTLSRAWKGAVWERRVCSSEQADGERADERDERDQGDRDCKGLGLDANVAQSSCNYARWQNGCSIWFDVDDSATKCWR